MAFWHCPHCGTPQAEAARCWVCRRSSTTCGTCRNFRAAVVGGLGYCALDRGRAPLRGDEVRGCWEALPARTSASAAPDDAVVPPPTSQGWAEVGSVGAPETPAPDAPSVRPAASELPPPGRPGAIDPPPVGLWGEIEP